MAPKYDVYVIGRDFKTDVREDLLDNLLKIKSLKLKSFKKELTAVVGSINSSLEGLNTSFENFELDEVTLNLEVSASGQIAIIGSGVSSGMKGGVQIKFKKK